MKKKNLLCQTNLDRKCIDKEQISCWKKINLVVNMDISP